MPNVAAIILAAGLSRRMDKQNKLLMPIGDVPMLCYMVQLYQAIVDQPVLVVTGHQAKDVEICLKGSGAETIFNPEYANGQSTSVACGLREVTQADEILIGLGDQPRLMQSDLLTLLSTHREGNSSKISIPKLNEKRGNPIIIPGSLRSQVLSDPRSPGCKKFTRTYPDHVQYHHLNAPGFYEDIDTPEAYHAFSRSQLEVAS